MQTISTREFNYKGLNIKAEVIYSDSQFSTTGGTAKRKWTVGGIEAHTFEIDCTVYLAYYATPASKGGDRIVLKDFAPDIAWHLTNTEKREIVTGKGKVFIVSMNDTDY
jgi:hypothetical protein